MKDVIIIVILTLCLIYVKSYADGTNQCDSNQLDSIGLKVGYWIEFSVIPFETELNVAVQDSDIIIIADKSSLNKTVLITQKGNYSNGLKNGLWKEYWPNGQLKSLINYINGIPIGFFKIYLANKKILTGDIVPQKHINIDICNEEGELLEKKEVEITEIMKLIY